jgi:transcriptional regulator with XRE-family HTH domain
MARNGKTGAVVLRLRRALGWSQPRFAARLGRTAGSVSLWEHGMEPSLGSLLELLKLANEEGLQDLAGELMLLLWKRFPLLTNVELTQLTVGGKPGVMRV